MEKSHEVIVLETDEARLWLHGEPHQLHGAVFRLLVLFIKREGSLVTKREILKHVWPDTNVSEASIKDTVKNLRSTLGDAAARPVFIETVRGRGYRFLGGVQIIDRLQGLPDSMQPEVPFDQTLAANETEPKGPRRSWIAPALGGALFLLIVVVSLAWNPVDDPEPARKDLIALPIPEKPSIAVTPFVNVANNPDIGWLSIGLSSNLITTIASSPDIVVISQNALSDMNDAKPGEIAERYGVRYVLDGTIQSDGTKLRVSARLADALAGRTLWSGKWDRQMDDVFAIQDEIADSIFEELQVRLTIGEQARNWRINAGSVENMRAFVIGRVGFQTFTPEGQATAERHWDAMLERDPELPAAMMLQGWLHWSKVMIGLSTDPIADLLAAQDWGQRAIDAGFLGHPHALVAVAASYLGQSDKALDYAEQGLRYSPGEADVVQLAGFVYATNGRLDEGIRLMLRGMRLEPDYPDWLAGSVTNAMVKAGRWKEARELALDVVSKNVKDENARFNVTVALVVLSVWEGRPNEAKIRLTDLLSIRPNLTVARIKAEPRYSSIINNVGDPGYVEKYISALKIAGLPDGTD